MPNISNVFDQVRDLIIWADESNHLDEDDREKLRRSVNRGVLESSDLNLLRDIFSQFQVIPDQYRDAFVSVEELLGVRKDYSTFRIPSVLENIHLTSEDDKKEVEDEIVAPDYDDPRAIRLTKLKVKEDEVRFLNGYLSTLDRLSFVAPILNEDGSLSLNVENIDPNTGKTTSIRHFETPFHKDGNTYFFARYGFEDCRVYGVTFDEKTGEFLSVDRYPNYSAAGFHAPIKRSVILSDLRGPNPNNTYIANIYINEGEEVQIEIIEDEKGNVVNLVYNELTAGELKKGEGTLKEKSNGLVPGQNYYTIEEHGLHIGLKKMLYRSGAVGYKIYVYHNLEFVRPITHRSHTHLQPVAVSKKNASWYVHAKKTAIILKKMLNDYEMTSRQLLIYLNKVRDNLGMKVVSEVIMDLYYGDENSRMAIINMWKIDPAVQEVKNLPIPKDSRIFPGSMDLISQLLSFFSGYHTRGYINKQLLQAVKQRFPELEYVEERYIEALWLYANYPTVAERQFHIRGDSTPEHIKEGYPVGSYRRILDESYTPILDSVESRREMRGWVGEMLDKDYFSASFKEYLGQQLDLAAHFDLLILEGGHLYYNNWLIRNPKISEDGKTLLAILDKNNQMIEIERPKEGERLDSKNPVLLSEERMKQKYRMAPHHPDDPFLTVYRNRKKIRRNGGSFINGNILMKVVQDDQTFFKVPTGLEIIQSMAGLQDLPMDYLERLIPNFDEDVEELEAQAVVTKDKKSTFYNLGAKKFKLDMGDYGKQFRRIKFDRYHVDINGYQLTVYIPVINEKAKKALEAEGYFIASEEQVAKIAAYYVRATTKGFSPDNKNIYIMPSMLSRKESRGGILGFYTFKSEDLVISSIKGGSPETAFKKWIAIRLFNTVRHEIGHAVKRANPWITSLLYRAMILDQFTVDYGNTDVEEYFSVVLQNFFDHKINGDRLRNGYKVLYNLIKLRELGVRWDGPYHEIDGVEEGINDDRNIDGVFRGVPTLRILATGGDPFAELNKQGPDGASGGGKVHSKKPKLDGDKNEKKELEELSFAKAIELSNARKFSAVNRNKANKSEKRIPLKKSSLFQGGLTYTNNLPIARFNTAFNMATLRPVL